MYDPVWVGHPLALNWHFGEEGSQWAAVYGQWVGEAKM